MEEQDNNNHGLVLSLINDLVRMQQNIDNMDATVKGVSQLKNRIKSIFTTLNINQYEIPDLVGTTYNDGDNMIYTMEYNSELPHGITRIKRVIKPQVSYNGKLIQAATVVLEHNTVEI